MRAKLLLKARPTDRQLADRLAPPRPEGLELYIDAQDLAGEGDEWLHALRARVAAAAAPPGFVYLVEGPIRSLDGRYFDLSRHSAADGEVVRRLVRLARAFGAHLVNIHCVAPVGDPARLTGDARARAIADARPFLTEFVARCRDAGVTPAIENIPPVSRMRERAYVFSAVGVEADDLRELCSEVPGLRVTLDVSHAQLYLNAAQRPDPRRQGQREGEGRHRSRGALENVEACSPPLQRAIGYYAARPHPGDLLAYGAIVEAWLTSAHISNARGLLGEGLPYTGGDVDLDPVVAWLARRARYLVTEPLEDDQDRAVLMRDMQSHLLRVIGTLSQA